jgi:hypothetical protein
MRLSIAAGNKIAEMRAARSLDRGSRSVGDVRRMTTGMGKLIDKIRNG